MASLLCSHLLPVSYSTRTTTRKQCRTKTRALAPKEKASPGNDDDSLQKSTELVTFLGKGGSGKTTSAVFAAKHYAMAGLSTCLVIHNQDPTSDYLLNCKIGNSPVLCQTNLSAVRLETTKMLLEPLDRLKQADKRLNFTQGVLGEIVGEELGILPGMDSIFSAIALERYVGFLTNFTRINHQKDKFDVIVYDGICTEETIRMLGAASKARLYLKYLRNISEKTELGRLASPSLLRLVEEAMTISSSSNSLLNGRTSPVIWENLEQMLEKGSSSFLSPHKFGCFIVMDPTNPISVDSALCYWGRMIQSGSLVSGAVGFLNSTTSLEEESVNRMKNNFSPLPFALIPHLSFSSPIDWNSVLVNSSSEGFRDLLSLSTRQKHGLTSSVKFDKEKKSVTLLMPGFGKSEIKLYQYRGGSELLVEAGDQRRVILLPKEIQGKVGGAKFMDRNLIITMQ